MRILVAPGGAVPNSAAGGSRLDGLGAKLRRIGAGWTRRRQAAREAQVLYNATDFELRDMGLSRGDIPAIINGTYRRD